MPTTATITFTDQPIKPAIDSSQFPAVALPIKLAASTTFAKGTILGEKTGNNEVVTVDLASGTASGGTFTLSFGGQTTSAIAYNAAASAVTTALEALSTIGADNISVTGSAIGTGYVLTFKNDLGNTNVGTVTVDGASLTGSSPVAQVTVTTAGSAGTPGEFAAYDDTATNGLQTPRCILPVACITDASGNITVTTTAGVSGGEHSETYSQYDAWFKGAFNTADVTAITDEIISAMNGRMLKGSIAGGGIFVI